MPHVQPLIVAQLIVLLALANGTPLIAKKILGTILTRPLDGGMILADGQPLFGPSKTIRGVVLSIVVTTLGAPSIGVDWTIGLVVAATAMIGDLFSSFTKRRMNYPLAAWPWAWIRPRSPSCRLSHVDGFCQSRSWISY